MRDVTISYGKCAVWVEGMEMKCPLCGTLVRSGENHACKVEQPARRQPRRQRHEATK
jgi:hypothetical protein